MNLTGKIKDGEKELKGVGLLVKEQMEEKKSFVTNETKKLNEKITEEADKVYMDTIKPMVNNISKIVDDFAKTIEVSSMIRGTLNR
jgi:phosphopantetheine adenylyltransferase